MATTKKAAETAAADYSTMNVFKKLQLAVCASLKLAWIRAAST